MRKWFLILAAIVTVTGCGDDPIADWSEWPQQEALGWRFAVPPEMSVSATETEIVLSAPKDRRQIDRIILRPGTLPALMLRADLPIISRSSTPGPHVIGRAEGGSGGREYVLFTSKSDEDRPIALTGWIQTEEGVPSFAQAWAVWESLRVVE